MKTLAVSLAEAFLAGPWEVDEMVTRGARVLGKRARWLQGLAQRIYAACAQLAYRSRAHIAKLIASDPGFLNACVDGEPEFQNVFWTSPAAMRPAAGAPQNWKLPEIATPGKLADWLELTPGRLAWFADCQSRERRLPVGRLRHYRYRWIRKRHGEARLIEIPKVELKQIQRRLLDELISRMPPHEAAHGFRTGRSIRTFAAPHVGARVVLRLDLKDFFPAITRRRVLPVFLTAGYPEGVARPLAGLCTNASPADVWEQFPGAGKPREQWASESLYAVPHLPQGAPTSPALANLCAFRLDCRLTALARVMGANYTRYADDLAFSGGDELRRAARRFQIQVMAIALEEGFRIHARKTRVMPQSSRQRLAGVIVNRHPNVCRSDFDRLKAILNNCARHGPQSQNREGHADFQAHLAGSIAHVAMLNSGRGDKLRRIFERILW
ncbi:MAG TPA: reverse transcriptase family protein [Pirellulales bacterium]|nr:reverse transcriptase family protein [Pirellulales bacterium]